MDKDLKIKELETKIIELQERLAAEINLKNCEILINSDLKEYNQKLEIQIDKLFEINQQFLDKIVKLNSCIKKITNVV